MQPIKQPPYIRSNNIDLAKWQSAVASTVRKSMTEKFQQGSLCDINKDVMLHAMVQGTNLHVARHTADAPLMTDDEATQLLKEETNKYEIALQSYLSQYYFSAAQDLKTGKIAKVHAPAFFPESDYAYIQWGLAAIQWSLDANPESSPYIDWKNEGQDINTFGVVQIPENSKIAIIGDYGTGLNDATMFLTAIIKDQQPDIIIHVGDIYYTGTEDECALYVENFAAAFAAAGKTVPVYSIPGNHEYYSGGGPFFKQVLPMNSKQVASYFCLQTANNSWQLLAMDTGYNSLHTKTGLSAVKTVAYAPWLTFNEAEWHVNKLENFTGKTILLSHHQLYSASSPINNNMQVMYQTDTKPETLTYFNGNLQAVFSPYYDRVAAWFWGHEHILGIYRDGNAGLAKGRLIGDSGYEEWEGEGPYVITDSGYPYQYADGKPIQPDASSVKWLLSNFQFINHSCAVVQLDGSSATVNYYQYPVLGPHVSIPPVNKLPPLTRIDFSDTL
ncbi:MAG: metallophosphoesterase [Ferruginibacter sp.]